MPTSGRRPAVPTRLCWPQTDHESWKLTESQHQWVHQTNLDRDDHDPYGGEHRSCRGDAETESLLAEQAKVASNPLNATMAQKATTSSTAMSFAAPRRMRSLLPRPVDRCSGGLVSGRRTMPPRCWPRPDRPPGRTAVVARSGAARAPIAGPATKPRPKAAPSRPNSRDRSLGPARSAARPGRPTRSPPTRRR